MSDILDEILALENKRAELLATHEKRAIATLGDITSSIDSLENYEPSEELLAAVNLLNDALGLNQEPVTRSRVSNEEKDDLFQSIIDDFKKKRDGDNGEWQLPYTQLSESLKEYGHEPANLSVFFRAQLKGLKSTGKTRNKALVFNGTNADAQPQ